MSNLKAIRERLGVTQRCLSEAIGCTQSNVSLYERGQPLPSSVAKRVIDYAATRGARVTFDDVYAEDTAPSTSDLAPLAHLSSPTQPAPATHA